MHKIEKGIITVSGGVVHGVKMILGIMETLVPQTRVRVMVTQTHSDKLGLKEP